MNQHFLISLAPRTPSVRSASRISDEQSCNTPPIPEQRAGCSKNFSGALFYRERLFSPVVGIADSVLFRLSQLGLLHFGQTLGLSPFSRGSHSWPHRHRQPSNNTIPIWVSSDPIIPSPLPTFTTGIYDCSCILNLPLVYTTGKGDMECGSGRFNRVNGWGGKSPLAARSSGKVASGLSRRSRGADATQSALTRPNHTAPAPTTPRQVNYVNIYLRCSL
jgi:hypothetical protein